MKSSTRDKLTAVSCAAVGFALLTLALFILAGRVERAPKSSESAAADPFFSTAR